MDMYMCAYLCIYVYVRLPIYMCMHTSYIHAHTQSPKLEKDLGGILMRVGFVSRENPILVRTFALVLLGFS